MRWPSGRSRGFLARAVWLCASACASSSRAFSATSVSKRSFGSLPQMGPESGGAEESAPPAEWELSDYEEAAVDTSILSGRDHADSLHLGCDHDDDYSYLF